MYSVLRLPALGVEKNYFGGLSQDPEKKELEDPCQTELKGKCSECPASLTFIGYDGVTLVFT